MKKIFLLLLLALCATPHCFAAETTSSLDSLGELVAKSENIVLYDNNAGNFGWDEGRIGRDGTEPAFATVRTNGAQELKLVAYSEAIVEEENFVCYASKDNEVFVPVKYYRAFNEPKIGYSVYELVIKDLSDYQYVKMEWKKAEKFSFLPQIGEIHFSDTADTYQADGLLFFEDFMNDSLMYGGKSWNLRIETTPAASTLGDAGRILRVYDLTTSVKYKIKNPLRLWLQYSIMDGFGEVKVYASSWDGDYKEVPSQKTAPVHAQNNWSVVYLTAEDFPDGTEFIKLVIPAHGHAEWPPMLSKMEVYY